MYYSLTLNNTLFLSVSFKPICIDFSLVINTLELVVAMVVVCAACVVCVCFPSFRNDLTQRKVL